MGFTTKYLNVAQKDMWASLVNLREIEDEMGVTFNDDRFSKLLEQREAARSQLRAVYKDNIGFYQRLGATKVIAELQVGKDFTKLKDRVNEEYISKIPDHKRIYNWLDHTTDKIVEKLANNVKKFKDAPVPEFETPADKEAYQIKEKRYELLKMMLEREPDKKNKKNELGRIVKGFLTEFIRQTEQQINACNIENGRNPDAKAYWESRPEEEFFAARCAGVMHTAFTYSRFKTTMQRGIGRKAAWDATGEVVRTCIDEFKAEYPRYDIEATPLASVYNNHLKAIAQTFRLENHFGTRNSAARG